MRVRWCVASVALLVGAPLTGCVGDETPAQAVGTQPARDGGVLRLGTTGPVVLDPLAIEVADPISVLVADAAFDGLTEFDPATREVVGAVAADWSTADGRVWEFRLSAERTFGDGSRIQAADVVASLERAATDERQPLAGARLEMIEGIAELRDETTATARGLEAEDGVVRITLVEVNRELPALLADPTYGIVPPGADGDLLVGSGPFGAAARDGSVLSLQPARKGAGAVDGLTVRSYETRAEVAEAFARDELDVRVGDGDDPAAVGSPGAEELWVSAATLFVAVNVAAPGMDDAEARRAVLSAVEPAGVQRNVGETRGRTATSLLPGDWIPTETCDACFEAPEDRDAVLAAFGASGVRLVGLGSGAAGRGAAAVERELADAGLVVSRPDDSAEGVRAAVLAGEWDLLVFAQVGLAPSADPFLAAAFTTSGSENLTGWSSSVVDGQVAAARGEPDRAARAVRYAAAELEVRHQAVARPLLSLGSSVLVQPRVKGASAIGGLAFDVRELSLDE